jgi:pimeloyl-ACP methyl ester carboxylesterase
MGRMIEMPLPRLGETMEEGRIGLIVKKPGDAFKRGETLLEVESDKTTVEVPALQDGILVEWLVALDQMVPVESAIARIEIEGEAVAEAKKPAAPVAASPTFVPVQRSLVTTSPLRARASTAARAAARRASVDLSGLCGSGRNGRITRADLAAATRPTRATYYVETPHGKIFYREWPAQGRAIGSVLLIHGLFSESQSFTTLGRKLAGLGFRTMAVDLPGHGETQSMAAAVDEIVDAIAASLPPEKLHIVAHSFGAVIATKLMSRALSLSLLSPAGCGEEINVGFIDAMLGAHPDQALPLLGEKVPIEVQASLADHLSVHGRHLRAIVSHVSRDGSQMVSILGALAAALIPVRAVFMRDDAVIPAHHALNLPFNVEVRMMPGASHLPHWRDPDAVVGLVADISGRCR